MTTEWQYLIVNQRVEEEPHREPQVIPFETWELDRYGRHGWELVTTFKDEIDNIVIERLVFKRPKQQPNPAVKVNLTWGQPQTIPKGH